MLATSTQLTLERSAPIPTWFGIGGNADRLARPSSVADVRRCVETDPKLRVLGDGANLLVDDDGVGELVIALTHPAMTAVQWDPSGRVTVMAGANLPKLINEAVRRGLGGIEGLGGIPATVGGALVMNAGGAFGQIGDAVSRVWGIDRAPGGGREVVLERHQIDFAYRRSGLQRIIITKIELRLTPGDKDALRDTLLEVMAYKKKTQPMAERSAGCCFKNPTVERARALDEGWLNGSSPPTPACRVSAGMLIDRAGCKGLTVGGATVSDWHANFFVVRPGAKARDVITLMDTVTTRVAERFGITIEPEVVIWRRNGAP